MVGPQHDGRCGDAMCRVGLPLGGRYGDGPGTGAVPRDGGGEPSRLRVAGHRGGRCRARNPARTSATRNTAGSHVRLRACRRSVARPAPAGGTPGTSTRAGPVRRAFARRCPAGWRQDQAADQVGAVQGDPLGDPASDVVPAQHRPVELELLDETDDAARLPGGAVLLPGSARCLSEPPNPRRSGRRPGAWARAGGSRAGSRSGHRASRGAARVGRSVARDVVAELEPVHHRGSRHRPSSSRGLSTSELSPRKVCPRRERPTPSRREAPGRSVRLRLYPDPRDRPPEPAGDSSVASLYWFPQFPPFTVPRRTAIPGWTPRINPARRHAGAGASRPGSRTSATRRVRGRPGGSAPGRPACRRPGSRGGRRSGIRRSRRAP